MKKQIFVFTALALVLALLAGCGGNTTAEESTAAMETVVNLFTTPTELSSTGDSTAETLEIPKKKGEEWGGSTSFGFTDPLIDETGRYLTYEGGEMHVDFFVQITGAVGNNGFGLMLILDGTPQIYRTADQEEYAYLHTFYPPAEDGGTVDVEIIFTPSVGKTGDNLLLDVIYVLNPNYDATAEITGFAGDTSYTASQLIFYADPPETETLAVTERVTEWNLEMQDLTTADIADWTTEMLQKNVSLQFSTNTLEESGMYFGVTEDFPLVYHVEVFSPSAVQWALLLYIDNQPVTMLPENAITFSVPSGQKAVIDIALDMTGYRECAPIYAVLFARNEWDAALSSTNCGTSIPYTIFLSREENFSAWLAKYYPD